MGPVEWVPSTPAGSLRRAGYPWQQEGDAEFHRELLGSGGVLAPRRPLWTGHVVGPVREEEAGRCVVCAFLQWPERGVGRERGAADLQGRRTEP